MPRKVAKLSLADQKRLAQIAARPDIPKTMQLRLWWLDKLWDDREWMYTQLKKQIETGDRETDSRARMLTSILDRILPSQRELTTTPDANAKGGVIGGTTIKILNVNRGTKQARTAAIEVAAVKRKALETAA